jgi:hypothetical protein
MKVNMDTESGVERRLSCVYPYHCLPWCAEFTPRTLPTIFGCNMVGHPSDVAYCLSDKTIRTKVVLPLKAALGMEYG